MMPVSAAAEKRVVVPLARVERALLAELDFESSASTNSATGARPDYLGTGTFRRNRLDQVMASLLRSWT